MNTWQLQDVPDECHPDQTTLCDFIFFSYCFHAMLRRVFDNNSKGKRAVEKMIFPAAPVVPADEVQQNAPILVKAVQTLLQRVAKCLKSRRFLSQAPPLRYSLYVLPTITCSTFFNPSCL